MAGTRPFSYARTIRPFQKSSRCRKGTRRCESSCVTISRKKPKRKLDRCKNGYTRCAANHTCRLTMR